MRPHDSTLSFIFQLLSCISAVSVSYTDTQATQQGAFTIHKISYIILTMMVSCHDTSGRMLCMHMYAPHMGVRIRIAHLDALLCCVAVLMLHQ